MNKFTLLKVVSVLILTFSVIPLYSYFLEDMKRRYRLKFKIKQEKDVNPIKSLTYKARFDRNKAFAFSSDFSKRKLAIFLYILSLFGPALLSIKFLLGSLIGAILYPFVLVSVINGMTKKELEQKDSIINRMLTFKRSAMGLVNANSNILTYTDEFEILEYDEDDNKPSKIRLYLPVNFDPIKASKFLEEFSIQFGRGRPFEIDKNDKDFPGWDTDKGVATIILEEKLPDVAMFDEHYLEDPSVQWSFFPLGIGSKGGIPIKNPKTGKIEHVVGIDVDGTQSKYCKKHNIPIGQDITAAPMTLVAGGTGGGKSVAQWNIMNACLARPKEWLLFGIDLKKVELSQLRQFGVAVGTTMEDARDIACFVQKVMMDRYEKMEKLRINNWKDLPEDDSDYGAPAIMLLIDEAGELLADIAGKSEEAKERIAMQDELRASLESIARLGRASRVFLIMAAQRPSADIIPMQIRQNMANRLGCGNLQSTISTMLFEGPEGTRIPGDPKGRCGLKVHSSQVNIFQGFYSGDGDEWISNYINKKGWPKNLYEADDIELILNKDKPDNDEMTEDDFQLISSALDE